MEDVNIVLITGMSGAGKTTAMSILEDMGYHCIDQFPVELIRDLGKLLRNKVDERYKNIALATSAIDYSEFLAYFENIGLRLGLPKSFLSAKLKRVYCRKGF